MNLNVTDDALAELEHDESILRMKHSMEKAGLHTFVAVNTRLILHILLSLIPANIKYQQNSNAAESATTAQRHLFST